ncbi:LysM peptidoglycan-binding domain-containing protein [Phenylobacterium sp.]|uniref:LysM peptidoglycan-binding domain-containing protein n=1 Tax=Phenylobacterium sp. TaxID=1871053 RepID=UPI0027349367|nr:LysM peptidoglycan-binding domain-containing protein [Phenylobacterium sp.]
MTGSNSRIALRTLAACSAVMVLAACASTGAVKSASAVASAPAATLTTPGLTARERVAQAVSLLGVGSIDRARAELGAALVEEPANSQARKLLNQIDQDPEILLGARHYTYRIKPGESLTTLADRLMGDRLMFYALARYNGIAAPNAARAGMMIKVPGVAPKAPPARAARPQGPATTTATASRDPARASRLRGDALEKMSGGRIDQAVSLLRQAQQLDPDSALIRRDLDRAQRIQTTVRKRS